MAYVNSQTVQQYVPDTYPQTKGELIQSAQNAGAEDDVIETLTAVSDREYSDAEDLASEIATLEG